MLYALSIGWCISHIFPCLCKSIQFIDIKKWLLLRFYVQSDNAFMLDSKQVCQWVKTNGSSWSAVMCWVGCWRGKMLDSLSIKSQRRHRSQLTSTSAAVCCPFIVLSVSALLSVSGITSATQNPDEFRQSVMDMKSDIKTGRTSPVHSSAGGSCILYLFIYYLEIHSFICNTREILNTSVCNMKSDRHQGNALTGASIKMTTTRYNKCKNPDKSEL